MLKTHKEVETRTVEIIDDIICNKCGKSITQVPHNQMLSPDVANMECVSIRKSWGFWSKKDMLTQNVDICEPCWDLFCETLAVPPAETDYDGTPFEEDPQLSLFTFDEMSGYAPPYWGDE